MIFIVTKNIRTSKFLIFALLVVSIFPINFICGMELSDYSDCSHSSDSSCEDSSCKYHLHHRDSSVDKNSSAIFQSHINFARTFNAYYTLNDDEYVQIPFQEQMRIHLQELLASGRDINCFHTITYPNGFISTTEDPVLIRDYRIVSGYNLKKYPVWGFPINMACQSDAFASIVDQFLKNNVCLTKVLPCKRNILHYAADSPINFQKIIPLLSLKVLKKFIVMKDKEYVGLTTPCAYAANSKNYEGLQFLIRYCTNNGLHELNKKIFHNLLWFVPETNSCISMLLCSGVNPSDRTTKKIYKYLLDTKGNSVRQVFVIAKYFSQLKTFRPTDYPNNFLSFLPFELISELRKYLAGFDANLSLNLPAKKYEKILKMKEKGQK